MSSENDALPWLPPWLPQEDDQSRDAQGEPEGSAPSGGPAQRGPAQEGPAAPAAQGGQFPGYQPEPTNPADGPAPGNPPAHAAPHHEPPAPPRSLLTQVLTPRPEGGPPAPQGPQQQAPNPPGPPQPGPQQQGPQFPGPQQPTQYSEPHQFGPPQTGASNFPGQPEQPGTPWAGAEPAASAFAPPPFPGQPGPGQAGPQQAGPSRLPSAAELQKPVQLGPGQRVEQGLEPPQQPPRPQSIPQQQQPQQARHALRNPEPESAPRPQQQQHQQPRQAPQQQPPQGFPSQGFPQQPPQPQSQPVNPPAYGPQPGLYQTGPQPFPAQPHGADPFVQPPQPFAPAPPAQQGDPRLARALEQVQALSTGQPTGLQQHHGASPTLDNVPLLNRAAKPPQAGWRRTVFQMTSGKVNLGESHDEKYVADLVKRLRRPARGDYRIAVLSLKGGVGKTTTTVSLGSTFASLRGDRVIAVDANPDFGTLAQRIPQQTRSTVRNLLHDPSLLRYSDVRAHTSQAPSRLEVLASERDPATSEAFSEQEYRDVVSILQRFYSIVLTDCGTGLMHSTMPGVLDLTQTLILVTSPAIDGARSAAATLDWLNQHGREELVRNSVVVINSARPESPHIGMEQLQQYFLSRCRAAHVIPFDEHLSTGAEVDLDLMSKHTRRAYLELAATVADAFDHA